MNDTQTQETTTDTGALAIINSSEIEQQIATAHRFPRSVRGFLDEARALVTLQESVANECIYALPPRSGKIIEGPSIRFAEIIVHAWGNSRAGVRVIDESKEFITAQGAFHDLEKNVAIMSEVKRRITYSNGTRYGPDMIGVTANAACSIALRNVILKGVPKAFWAPLYDEARQIVMGDAKTLASRRTDALAFLQKFGVTEVMIFGLLDIVGVEDITLEHLVVLRGVATAIRDGDTTVEQAFPAERQSLTDQVRRKSEAPPVDRGADGGGYSAEQDATNPDNYPRFINAPDGSTHWIDIDGLVFSEKQHGWSKEHGKPAVTKAGRFRAKRAKPEPAQQPPEESDDLPEHTRESLAALVDDAQTPEELDYVRTLNAEHLTDDDHEHVLQAIAARFREIMEPDTASGDEQQQPI